jgi:DNA polymerase
MINIDFEVYSEVDLIKQGLWKYAMDKSTDVLCMAYSVNSKEPELWLPTMPAPYHLFDMIRAGELVHAFNATFEYAIWNYVLDWPKLQPSNLRCTQALAMAHGLPMSLDNCANILKVEQQKQASGKSLIKLLCIPQADGTRNTPETHRREFKLLYDYCLQDVRAEQAVRDALPRKSLTPYEQKLWEHTVGMNERGIPLDIPAIVHILYKKRFFDETIAPRLIDLSDGEITKPTQVQRIKQWVNKRMDTPVSDLQADTIDTLLENPDLSDEVQEMLTLRQAGGKTSVAKLETVMGSANSDGRIRGNLIYYGAHTGRWTGAGFQPLNLPRASVKDPEAVIYDIEHMTPDDLFEKYPRYLHTASALIRNVIKPPEGNCLYVADFEAIEYIVNCWKAGELEAVERFNQHKDQYKDMASFLTGIPYDDIDDKTRFKGKTIILGCGYQMGAGKFQHTAAGYGWIIDDDTAQHAVNAFREKYSNIVSMWWALENAAVQAILTHEETRAYGISFKMFQGYLFAKLPSGRLICYPKAHVSDTKTPWGAAKKAFGFYGIDGASKKWARKFMSPGKITENVIQAISRDIMCDGLMALEAKGYGVIFHIYDEVVAETPTDFGSIEEFTELMCAAKHKPWYAGLPIRAGGEKLERYKKL